MEVVRLFKSTREYLTPVLKQSAFLDRGMLTPEEFITAGDQLINACPTWIWQSCDECKIRDYLPKEKQYLVTRGVPCYRRLSEMDSDTIREINIEGISGSNIGDWCLPEVGNSINETDRDDMGDVQEGESRLFQAELVIDERYCATAAFSEEPIRSGVFPLDKSVETSVERPLDEYLDESLALDDATIMPPPPPPVAPKPVGTSPPILSSGPSDREEDDQGDGEILRCRRYDISITYDNYYRTPRVWLFGYDENGAPLPPDDIFQDIMTDYVNRTVTVDPHPHLGRMDASIHPCRHGPAMKRILDALVAGGKTPSVNQYLFIFLKFIQGVIPTIEYDFTMDVRVHGKAST